MRIALLHLFGWPHVRRGGERYLHDLARTLAAAGHEVQLVVGSAHEVHAQTGVRSRRLAPFDPTASPADPRHTMRAVGALLPRRPDVVHAFVPNLALAGWLTRTPTVFTLLGWVPPPSRRSRAWELAARRSRVVATLNAEIASDLEVATGRPAEVLTPGIDLDAFPLEPAPRDRPPRLLFSGHLGTEARYKGLDRVLAAFARVVDQQPGARLALSGPGDPSWALDGAPAAVRGRVDVLGTGDLAAVAERYRDATVTVHAARNEGFGLTVLESLASGTPVVAARRGGPAALLTGRTGRFADPADPTSLAGGILAAIELARDPATPQACRRRAERWSWEQVGPAHERLYARIAHSPGARPAPAAARRAPSVGPAETGPDAGRATVIIPVRDRADLLRDCLDGLARQTTDRFDVVVVDDGSTDDSAAVARSYADTPPDQGGLCLEVVASPGLGAVGARRLGVEATDAPYLAFTDSDCVPDPDWVAAGLRALDAGADLVQGRTRAAGPRTPFQHSVAAAPGDGLYATCNVFYRRSAYEAAGGFDLEAGRRLGFRWGPRERGLGFGEDTLLGWRVRRQGRVVHTEEAVVHHQVFDPDPRDTVRRWWMAGGFPALVRELPELRDAWLHGRMLVPGPGRPLLLAAGALAALGARRLAAVSLAGWVTMHGRRVGWHPRALAHELARDTVIQTVLVAGSARARNLVL